MKFRTLPLLLLLSSAALAQTWTHPDLDVRVRGLQFQAVKSDELTAPLAAALQTVLGNTDLCCGKDSTLEDTVGQVSPLSLQLAASKIEGRRILPDGRPVIVSTDYSAGTDTAYGSNATGKILGSLRHNQPLLLEWKSRIYVVYGAVITETDVNSDSGGGGVIDTIEQLLLYDPAKGRTATFRRERDDWKQVQGLLTVSVAASSS